MRCSVPIYYICQEEYSAALMLPEGSGPFPVIVISHGAGGAGFVMHGISDPDMLKEAEFDKPIKPAIFYYPQSTTIFRNFKGKIDIPTIFITGDKDAIWASTNHRRQKSWMGIEVPIIRLS